MAGLSLVNVKKIYPATNDHKKSKKKPSVSVAMKNLRENGYITVSPEGYIHLTESGLEVAEKIYERHTILSNWLTMLGVDPRVAAEDACKIEHDVSAESFEAINRHINSSAGKI